MLRAIVISLLAGGPASGQTPPATAGQGQPRGPLASVESRWEWLVANAHVNAATLTTRGWGKAKPVAHNTKPDGSDDPEGRAKNRRVEIVVRKGA